LLRHRTHDEDGEIAALYPMYDQESPMKTSMIRRFAITAAAIAPIALSTSLASAGWSTINTSSEKRLAYSFAGSGSKSTTYAGRTFAVGYSTGLNANVTHFPTVHFATGYADGHLDVPVTFFNKSGQIFSAKAKAFVTSSTYTGAQPIFTNNYEIRVLGSIVKSGSMKLNVSGTLATYTHTLLTAEAEVPIYGVPINFTADATGTLSLKGSLGWSSGKLTVGLTPGASVDAAGSAAVGGSLAGFTLKAGVEVNLNVLDASVPLTASVTPLVQAFIVSAKGSLALSGMGGSFGVFAEACGPFGNCKKLTQPVFSWGGGSYSLPNLFNVSQNTTI
jgi:hypothetical protein